MANHVTLEHPNSFVDTNQKIGTSQIVAVKFGSTQTPASTPDFKGQMYFSLVNDNPYLYIANGTSILDWEQINVGGAGGGDVELGKANNFTDTLQTILNKQITTVHFVNTEEPQGMPNFAGQLCVSKFNGECRLYVAVDGANWELLSGETGVDLSDYAKLDSFNDFQKIPTFKGDSMVSVATGPDENPNGHVIPDYHGQLYLGEKTNGETSHFIANMTGGWDELDGNGSVDLSDYAKLDAINDFKEVPTYDKNPIVSVVYGEEIDPNGKITPTYPGQLYMCEDDTNTMWYYIANISDGWDLINEEFNTANFVRTNIENNFDQPKQTIKNNQIVSVVVKDETPNVLPDFVGQVYVDTSRTEGNIYVAVTRNAPTDPQCWICVNMPGAMPDGTVNENFSNDFQIQRQRIKGNQIATVEYGGGIDVPTATSDDIGKIYVKEDGSTASFYICVKDLSDTYKYIPLAAGGSGSASGEYARKDKVNNFVAVNDLSEKEGQLIHGRPVLCSVVSDKTPDDSLIHPEFRGQLYIYRKPIVNSFEWDTALWIADDQGGANLQWTPLQRDLSQIFPLKASSNLFQSPVQLMQVGEDTSTTEFIMGAKIVKGRPDTLGMIPHRIGEVVISEIDFTPPTPSIYRVFVGIGTFSSADWICIWDMGANQDMEEWKSDVVTRLEALDHQSTGKVTSLESTTTDHESRISALEATGGGTADPEHERRIADLETSDATNTGKITVLENRTNAMQTTVDLHDLAISSTATTIARLDGEVDDNKDKIANLETSDSTQSNKISILEDTAVIKNKANAITGDTTFNCNVKMVKDNASVSLEPSTRNEAHYLAYDKNKNGVPVAKIGYVANSTDEFTVVNEIDGGNLALNTTGAGAVLANGNEVLVDSADYTSLNTTDKTIIGAINEVKSNTPDITSLTSRVTAAEDNITQVNNRVTDANDNLTANIIPSITAANNKAENAKGLAEANEINIEANRTVMTNILNNAFFDVAFDDVDRKLQFKNNAGAVVKEVELPQGVVYEMPTHINTDQDEYVVNMPGFAHIYHRVHPLTSPLSRVDFTSNDDSVATVDDFGVIYPQSRGTTLVKLTSAVDGTIEKEVNVRIVDNTYIKSEGSTSAGSNENSGNGYCFGDSRLVVPANSAVQDVRVLCGLTTGSGTTKTNGKVIAVNADTFEILKIYQNGWDKVSCSSEYDTRTSADANSKNKMWKMDIGESFDVPVFFMVDSGTNNATGTISLRRLSATNSQLPGMATPSSIGSTIPSGNRGGNAQLHFEIYFLG